MRRALRLPWGGLIALLLVACAHGTGEPAPDAARWIDGAEIWLLYERIPARWVHLFTGDVTGPYALAFSQGLACRIPPEAAVHLHYGDALQCAWRTPR